MRVPLRPLVTVLLAVLVTATLASPAAAGTARPPTPFRVDVSYPLRHSFSMAVGLPGAGRHEPTSCYDIPETDDYLCRIVAGVEETGDRRNFFVRRDDGLDDSDDDTGTFGHLLIARDGVTYEGCHRWRSGDWFCDYASRSPVSRRHYDNNRFVLRVFWEWRKHTQGQAGCAAALSGLWNKGGWRAFLGLLDSCLNAPMERP